jgi:spore coat protein U-like protein
MMIQTQCIKLHPREIRNPVLRHTLACLFPLLMLLPAASFAATSCTFDSSSAVNFGSYNVFATLPNNNGIGSLIIHCQGGNVQAYDVTLSTGLSNNYATRVMMSGVNTLNYNLYTSTARSVIWGDGTGGSSLMSVGKNTTTTLSVFGQIPAGQDAAVGIYTDSIITTITF